MLIKLKPNTPGQRGTVLVSKKHLSKNLLLSHLQNLLHLLEVEITKAELLQEEKVEE